MIEAQTAGELNTQQQATTTPQTITTTMIVEDLDNGIEIYFDPTGSYLTTDFNSNGDDHGTEIALESLPQHVQDSLFINYPSQSLFKVQLEASGHYKIFFKNQSQVYFDDNGNQIKINSLKK